MHKRHADAHEAAIRWFRDAQLTTVYTDPLPLLSALKVLDSYWPSGLIGARIESGSRNGDASIWLQFKKPPKQREPNERDWTEFRLEPEAVFVLLAHCFSGFRLGIKPSKGHNGSEYYYLGLFKGAKSVRFHRFIANTSADRLGRLTEDFHDLRTSAVMQSMSIGAASKRHGNQKNGPYARRQEFINLATADFERLVTPTIATKHEYRALLNDVYKLLDLRKSWL